MVQHMLAPTVFRRMTDESMHCRRRSAEYLYGTELFLGCPDAEAGVDRNTRRPLQQNSSALAHRRHWLACRCPYLAEAYLHQHQFLTSEFTAAKQLEAAACCCDLHD